MALEGTLQDFGLSDIFQLIAIQQKTGVLSLKAYSDDVTVYFRGGDVVFADSRHRNVEDRLGRLMLRSGMISAEVLDLALCKQKQTLQRLGRILVDDGHITQQDLDRALELQVAQIVYRLFRWQVGDYRFRQEDELDLDRNHATLISAQHLLMEGVRMIDEWPMLERKIQSMQMVFERVDESLRLESLEEGKEVELLSGQADDEDDDLLDGFDELDVLAGFGEEEPSAPPVVSSATLAADGVLRVSRPAAQVYAYVDGNTAVEDLVDCTLLGEFGTCRGLFELLEKKVIRVVDAPVDVPAATPWHSSPEPALVEPAAPAVPEPPATDAAAPPATPVAQPPATDAAAPPATPVPEPPATAPVPPMATAVAEPATIPLAQPVAPQSTAVSAEAVAATPALEPSAQPELPQSAPAMESPPTPEATPVASPVPAAAPATRRRLSLLPLAYLALAVVALVSTVTMTRNPLNLVPVSLEQSPTVDAFRRLVSRNRVDRVDRALYIYFLEHQRFAASLADLVGEGVLPADAVVDPWGREYSYQVLPQGYRVMGFDNGGVEDATLSRTRRFPTGILPQQ